MNKPMRIARHVYLRTQQRRLRHMKGILIRNLTPSRTFLKDPLRISVFFTVHTPQSPYKVLFKSEPVQDSYNPSWESIQLPGYGSGHYQSFILRVWVECKEEEIQREGERCSLAFEKKVELFDLSYLGLMINKDGSSYPPNSVVVSMYEGLYSCPEVGGVPCAPRVVHTLTDYLPPQSLLEVPKKEVADSYHQPELTRILEQQENLNTARRETRYEKDRVEHYVQLERRFFEKRAEREKLLTRIKLFRAQLQEMESPEKEESEYLERVTKQADEAERDLLDRQTLLEQKLEDLRVDNSVLAQKRDKMQRCKRNRYLRQRYMVHELGDTFLIRERNDTFTICNIILPNADQLEQPTRVEQLGVALGYVAHLIHHLGKILFIPLLYPIRPQGSKSVICDLVSEETLIDNIKEFPLFAKGSEKALFQYAVFLLNKDIAQVRQHCGYGTSKTMFKRTLPNLKFLLDRLTREIRAMMKGNNRTAVLPPPSDITSMTSSYVSVDTVSMTSGSVAGSLQSPPEDDSLYSFSSQTSSMYPSSYTQTQKFIQHNTSFSSNSISSDHVEFGNHRHPHTPATLADTNHLSLQDDARHDTSCAVDDEADTPLVHVTTEHTFAQPLANVHGEEDEQRRAYFTIIDKNAPLFESEEEEEEEEGEEEEEEDGSCSGMLQSGKSESADSNTTSSAPSLSTTPVVNIEELATVDETRGTLKSTLSSLFAGDETASTEFVSEPSSSVVSQTGPLEETLKSAVHMTQVLLGHVPPEHIESVPVISTTSDAAIESTHALLDLTTASFVGNRVVELPQQTVEEKTGEDDRQNNTEYIPTGPPLIPDSFELSALTNRHSRDERHTRNQEEENDLWEQLQPRARSSAFSVDSMGYIKTGMATPHRVGDRADKDEQLSSVIRESSRRPTAGKTDENQQSLADFIERPSTGQSPQNRWNHHDGPNNIGYRRAL